MNCSRLTASVRAQRRAFTLIELLVVIAIIAILASVLLPVLHQAQVRGETATCVNNQKQLATAWLLYSSDNSDYCPGNNWQDEQDWLSYPNENWVAGWEGADGSGGDGTGGGKGGPDNTNAALLVNSTYSTLGDFTRVPKIYLCPASQVVAPVNTTGTPVYPMCRTVSMNCFVGYNCLPAPGEPSGVTQGHPIPTYSGVLYQVYQKTTQAKGGLGPSDLFVFMEERAESIDDGSFATDEGQGNTIVNWPTDYHNNAATIGFADGHVDVHRWFNSSTSTPGECFTAPQQETVAKKWGGATAGGHQAADIIWLQQHASQLIQ